MEQYIWLVESYKKLDEDKYDVFLVEQEPAWEPTWDDLLYTFEVAPYTAFNSYHIMDGVNCQGMTIHIADWCARNDVEYHVTWTTKHVWIYVRYGGQWYKMDFGAADRAVTETTPYYVTEGMVKDDNT